MKVFKSSKAENSYFNKIDWIRLIISMTIVFIFSSGFLSLLAQAKDMGYTIRISLIIATIVGVTLILDDILENRDRIYFLEKGKLSYIEMHEDKAGKLLTHKEYKNMIKENDLIDMNKNIKKYEGVDQGVIKEVLKVKKRLNKTIVKAIVKANEWEAIGRFTITKMELHEVEKEKTFIIMNDYENYDELIKHIKNNLFNNN